MHNYQFIFGNFVYYYRWIFAPTKGTHSKTEESKNDLS